MSQEHNMRRVTAIRNGTVIDHIPADITTKYPNITAFRARMEAKPEIAAYLNKPK